MKKFVFISLLLILIISLSVIVIRMIPVKPFYLNDKYYESANIKEISFEELEMLVNNKENFALFVYQPMCLASSSFDKILKEFTTDNQLTFYKIPFNKIKGTKLGKKIKYYPSFALYKNGKLKLFLDANSNKDLEYLSSKDGFTSWFNKYIKFKKVSKTDKEENNNTQDNTNITNNENTNIVLKDVTKEEGKVNIYFFWGNGCPVCKKEFQFFNELDKTYQDKFNLYTYEVWYNEENVKILEAFANTLNEELNGVPFTIIGSQVFKGFGEPSKEEMIRAIETESLNSYDVYFDRILNTN